MSADTSQTWRVVEPDRRATTVEIAEPDEDGLTMAHAAEGWMARGRSPLRAVIALAAKVGAVEILAPGEPSRAELIAAHAAAIARAVAEERESAAVHCAAKAEGEYGTVAMVALDLADELRRGEHRGGAQ